MEYAIAEKTPVSPNSTLFYLGSILLGFFIPITILYMMFLFNRKIFSKEQLLELDLPISIVSEIPEINEQANTTIDSSNERSPPWQNPLEFFTPN